MRIKDITLITFHAAEKKIERLTRDTCTVVKFFNQMQDFQAVTRHYGKTAKVFFSFQCN